MTAATTITFLGAAGTVTGSRFLVESSGRRVLVDAGLYQGPKELQERNRAPLPVDPASIDAIVITHAHIDHCGYLPVLVRDGFTGPVVASEHTADLMAIVLPDSGHLQEEEAKFRNRKGASRHHPALPLYTEADARAALESVVPIAFHLEHQLVDSMSVVLHPAGHILGSSIVNLDIAGDDGTRRVKFSGDLGRPAHPLLVAPHTMGPADVLLVESTYGNRIHDDAGAMDMLAAAIDRTAASGGVCVIPSFAVDRTEVVLYHLAELVRSGVIPSLPVYVDSPMALAGLAVYRHAIATRTMEIRPEIAGTDPYAGLDLHEVRDVQDSMALDQMRFPAIIISASGMASGGRVLHHLDRYLPDHRSTVVLVGFQAAQTRGRRLSDGAKAVRLFGREVPVRAKVYDLPSMSVHADQSELISWLGNGVNQPHDVYIVHGEPAAAEALHDAIRQRLGWNAVVAEHGQQVQVPLAGR